MIFITDGFIGIKIWLRWNDTVMNSSLGFQLLKKNEFFLFCV